MVDLGQKKVNSRLPFFIFTPTGIQKPKSSFFLSFLCILSGIIVIHLKAENMLSYSYKFDPP